LLVKVKASLKGSGLGDSVKFFLPFIAIPVGRATPFSCLAKGGLKGLLCFFEAVCPCLSASLWVGMVVTIVAKKRVAVKVGAANRFPDVRYNHKAFRREKIPRQECDGSVGVGCSLALYGA
jgi:hypothetical protein